MRKENNPLWSAIKPIWLKYCGVCDEYLSLKSKWKYISSIPGLNAFPPKFNDNFDRVDNAIEKTDKIFQDYLHMLPPLKGRKKFKNLKMDYDQKELLELQARLYSISHYLGILKLIFFQRTVSFDIQEVASGLPTSPEITTGNEAIYIGADKVAERYLDCINTDPGLIWDQAISFVYPIQYEYFFGGYSSPDKYLKSVHILLSEENKHFLGSLLILAHEVGHTAHYVTDNTTYSSVWLKESWKALFLYQSKKFGKLISEKLEKCKNCYCKFYLVELCPTDLKETTINPDETTLSSHEFRQNIADLIALLIGGPMTMLVFIDNILKLADNQRNFPLRVAFLLGYCMENNMNEFANLLEKEIQDLKTLWKRNISNYNSKCPKKENEPDFCFLLQLDIGVASGRFFALNEKELLEKITPEELDLPEIKNKKPDKIMNYIVKHMFKINEARTEKICSKLSSLQPCPSEDPRYILDCYYRLFRETNPPNYATVLFSLAHNTFRKRNKK